MSYYINVIKKIDPVINARWAEAWIRLEHGTLDSLSQEDFKQEVLIARNCILQAGEEASEKLAISFGI